MLYGLLQRKLIEFDFLKYNNILELFFMIPLFSYMGYPPIISILMFPYGIIIAAQAIFYSKRLRNRVWIFLIGILIIIFACDQVQFISLLAILVNILDFFGQNLYFSIETINLIYYFSFNIIQSISILLLPCVILLILHKNKPDLESGL